MNLDRNLTIGQMDYILRLQEDLGDSIPLSEDSVESQILGLQEHNAKTRLKPSNTKSLKKEIARALRKIKVGGKKS